jgi:hypothetical protein
MNVFIASCHASLEFDQVIMFGLMGHNVAGSFDVGSKQRPKIVGITDKSNDVRDAFKGADMIVMHQCENYSNVFQQYCNEMGKRPVVLNYFGQGCEEQHKHVATILKSVPNAYVVCYSRKEERMFKALEAPDRKFRMIRFGKVLDDFALHGGWDGTIPMAYMTCNSAERRGEGCGWPALKELMDSMLPMILSGKETETLRRGIGELDYEGMKTMYRNARCFVSLGTVPAPMVLTQIEAMVMGCPVIVMDNGCGIAQEGLPLIVVKNTREIAWWVESFIVEYPRAVAVSKKAATQVEDEFNMEKVAGRWASFMEGMK